MKRTTWFGLVLVALVTAGCSSGGSASVAPSTSGVASLPVASESPPSVAPPAGSSSTASVPPSASPSSAAACPENPTLADVIALDQDPSPLTVAFRPIYGTYSQAALACYGDKELRFVAFVAAPEGLGGVDSFRVEPLWLFARGHWLAVDDSKEAEGFSTGPFLPVAVSPADETGFADLSNRWVEIRGHFADRAAETCKVTQGSPSDAPTADQAMEICRTAFVVTAAEPVPAPSR